MALHGSIANQTALAEASTTAQRSLVGDSGWVDHLTVNFTTTEIGPVECVYQAVHQQESGEVNTLGRFELDSTTTAPGDNVQIAVQGFGSGMAPGSHTLYALFEDVSIGNHTIILQLRNASNSSTGTAVWGNPGTHAADRVMVIYRG